MKLIKGKHNMGHTFVKNKGHTYITTKLKDFLGSYPCDVAKKIEKFIPSFLLSKNKNRTELGIMQVINMHTKKRKLLYNPTANI